MTARIWRTGSLIAGLVISVSCLVIAFRQVNRAELATSFRDADYRWLLAYPLLGIALNLMRSEIWRVLLLNRVRVAAAFWAYAIGFLFNNVLPFRVGEAARILVLSRREGVPLAESAATAGLERLLDLAAVLIALACTVPVVTIGAEVRSGAALAAAMVAAGLLGVAFLARWGASGEAFLTGFVTRAGHAALADGLGRRWNQLVDGLSRLFRPRVGAPAFGGALVVWALTIVAQWTVLRAFQPNAGLIDAAFMVAVVSLAIAVPAAPGFVGTYQWVGQQALAVPFPERYTESSALAIAIMAHAVSYIFSTVLGLIGLWYFGVSFGALGRELRQPAPAAEGSA